MEKTYQVIFSREIDTKRVTIECTVKAKTFSEAEWSACKEINGHYFKAALTGDHEHDFIKSADYIIDDLETLNENDS